MGRQTMQRKRQRGSIEELPSGALRVRVYAGKDPVSKRAHYLREVVPPGPDAGNAAEAARTRLLNQVDEGRHPRTSATVDQLLDRYLGQVTVERSTRTRYHEVANVHIRPFIGAEQVGTVDAEVIDALYAEMRRCRVHCAGGRQVDHRTPRPHECDTKCTQHTCKPLGEATIRKAHYVLSGAFRRAKRWGWVSTNPIEGTEPPQQAPANPEPPTATEAAQLLNQAWQDDPEWGTLVWLAMITGSRRGEVCGLRWRHVDLGTGVLHMKKAIGQDGAEIWEKDTKTHQSRRVVVDATTVELLTEQWQRSEQHAAALGVELTSEAFLFSTSPDGSAPRKPASVTQRYGRLCTRVGVDSHLHALRHFSATELIAAGVDIRTVAGRLGHGSGGATTLRVYAAWRSEADQRAAPALFKHMPDRPNQVDQGTESRQNPRYPYEKVAAAIWEQIAGGELTVGTLVPSQKDIAAQHGVSVGTAHRAMELLGKWGVVEYRGAKRAEVVGIRRLVGTTAAKDGAAEPAPESLDLDLLHLGQQARTLRVQADPADSKTLHQLLIDAVRRHGGPSAAVGDYELNVRYAGDPGLVTTVAAVGGRKGAP